MRKVTYSLKIGLVGSPDSGKDFIETYLGNISLEVTKQNGFIEYLIIHDLIPIKLKIFDGKDLNALIYNYDKIENLDVLLIVLNQNDEESLNQLNQGKFEEFKEYFFFKGISALIGVGKSKLNENGTMKEKIIQKAKELELIYAFQLDSEVSGLDQIKNKILDDFLLKFQYSSAELLEAAKDYGIELINQREQSQIEEDLQKSSENEKETPSFEDLKLMAIKKKFERSIKTIIRSSDQELLEHAEQISQELIEHLELEEIQFLDHKDESVILELIENKVEKKEMLETKEKAEEHQEIEPFTEELELSKEISIEESLKKAEPEELKVKVEQSQKETLVREKIITIDKSEGRRKCPKCGCDDNRMIHESMDKTNIVLDYPRLYGKKYRCGECGSVWRER